MTFIVSSALQSQNEFFYRWELRAEPLDRFTRTNYLNTGSYRSADPVNASHKDLNVRHFSADPPCGCIVSFLEVG